MGEWLAFLKNNSPEHYRQACLCVEAYQEELDVLRMQIRQQATRESALAEASTVATAVASAAATAVASAAPLQPPSASHVPASSPAPSLPFAIEPAGEAEAEAASATATARAFATTEAAAEAAAEATAATAATKSTKKAITRAATKATSPSPEQASPPATAIRLQQEMQGLQYDESVWTTTVLDGIVSTQPDAFFWQAAAQGVLPTQPWALEACDMAFLHKKCEWFSMYVAPMDAPAAGATSITTNAAKNKWWSTNGKYVACALAVQLVSERHSASAAELHFHTPVRVVLRNWLMALVDTLSRSESSSELVSEEEQGSLCQEATMLINLLEEEFYQRVTTLYRAAAYECVPVWSLAHGMAVATIMARDDTWMPPLRSWSANQVPESLAMMDALIERNLSQKRSKPVKGHKRK